MGSHILSCTDDDDNEELKVTAEGGSHSFLCIGNDGNDGNDKENVWLETEIIIDDNYQTPDSSDRKEWHDDNNTLEKNFNDEHWG